MSYITHKIDGIKLSFRKDERHPWPYYEGHTYQGLHLSLLIPKGVASGDIKRYLQKVRRERDLVGKTIYRAE